MAAEEPDASTIADLLGGERDGGIFAPDRSRSSPADERADGRRLLLVEDSPSSAEALEALLRNLGYEVVAIAGTAGEAIEAATRERPDLAIVDIGLPGERDGVDAGRELAAGDTPVLYLTAMDDPETLARAEVTGPYGYVIKPADARGLVAAIEVALVRRDMERKLRDSERRFRLLIENAQDLITVLGPDGTIRFESPSVRRVLGYDPAELRDETVFDYCHPEDRADAMQAFNAVVREPGRTLSHALRFRHRDGSWVWLEAVGTAFRNEEEDRLFIVANSRDVTEQRRMQDSLRRSEQRYRRLFENSLAGVYLRDVEGELLELNSALSRALGYESPDRLVGSSIAKLYGSPTDLDDCNETLRKLGQLASREVELRHRAGHDVTMLESCSLLADPDRATPVVVGTLIDVSEQKRLADELARMAFTDPLTGLANRRFLEAHAERLLSLADRRATRAAVAYLDLTGFKRINDTLGHEAGDRVLVTVAERLQAEARGSDVAARIGGDEFAVLLAEVEDRESAIAAARRLAEAAELPIEMGEETLRIRPRIGVALFPDHATDFPTLLSAADRAMYAAEGSAGVGLFAPSSRPGAETDAEVEELEADLRQALERDELVLYYQPILSVAERTLAGLEALIRWRHPSRGLSPAGAFLPAVRSAELRRSLDEWVLASILDRPVDPSPDGEPTWMSVNLSADSLRDADLILRIDRLLGASPPPGHRLVFEVDAPSAMDGTSPAAGNVRALKDRGFGLAFDHGRERERSAIPERFPGELLKLGESVTRDLDRSRDRDHLARTLVQLGHTAGFRIVMEHVERPEQAEWVERSGCDFIQGHHIAEPLSPAELEAWMRGRRPSGEASRGEDVSLVAPPSRDG